MSGVDPTRSSLNRTPAVAGVDKTIRHAIPRTHPIHAAFAAFLPSGYGRVHAA